MLPLNITLFCFDFSGCGLSEGEYISLGHFEKDDVAVVIDYLRSIKTVSSIGIWGRSMGAVTAIMHSIRDPTIGGMVLDSPFMSLKILAEELCKEHTKIPKTILEAALKMIRKTILQRAGFDILQLEPIKYVRNTFVPAFFVAGKNDNFIKPHHAQNLCKYYAGDKNIVIVDGDHNDERPEFLMNSVSIFFYNCLQCELLFGKKMDTPAEKEGHNKTSIKNPKKENKIGNEKEINQALQFFGPEAKKFQEKLEKKNDNRKESIKNNDEELWNKLQFSEFSKEEVEWNDKVLDKEISELLEKTDLMGSKKEETKSEKTENLKTLQKTNKEIKKVDVINDDLLDLKQNEDIPKKNDFNLMDIDFFFEKKT